MHEGDELAADGERDLTEPPKKRHAREERRVRVRADGQATVELGAARSKYRSTAL